LRPKPKKNFLNQIYRQDPASGAYVIEAALDVYRDVFNEWDPAPFKRRDLDPDLNRFLQECASDIPLRCPIILCFHIPRQERDQAKEDLIRSGIRTYFSFSIHLVNREMREYNRRAFRYVLTSIVFLFAAFGLAEVLKAHMLLTILGEGLFIGGWVFLWEALATIAFKKKDLKKNRGQYVRFRDADVRFRCDQ
jgi:hypothetical protein